jgi:hypothetical protein
LVLFSPTGSLTASRIFIHQAGVILDKSQTIC